MQIIRRQSSRRPADVQQTIASNSPKGIDTVSAVSARQDPLTNYSTSPLSSSIKCMFCSFAFS